MTDLRRVAVHKYGVNRAALFVRVRERRDGTSFFVHLPLIRVATIIHLVFENTRVVVYDFRSIYLCRFEQLLNVPSLQ